jgi:hypothetical protein
MPMPFDQNVRRARAPKGKHKHCAKHCVYVTLGLHNCYAYLRTFGKQISIAIMFTLAFAFGRRPKQRPEGCRFIHLRSKCIVNAFAIRPALHVAMQRVKHQGKCIPARTNADPSGKGLRI